MIIETPDVSNVVMGFLVLGLKRAASRAYSCHPFLFALSDNVFDVCRLMKEIPPFRPTAAVNSTGTKDDPEQKKIREETQISHSSRHSV